MLINPVGSFGGCCVDGFRSDEGDIASEQNQLAF